MDDDRCPRCRQERVRSTKEHHRTEWSHNGERTRVESCWFWECVCGAGEAASTKREAQLEWIRHLEWIRDIKEEAT